VSLPAFHWPWNLSAPLACNGVSIWGVSTSPLSALAPNCATCSCTTVGRRATGPRMRNGCASAVCKARILKCDAVGAAYGRIDQHARPRAACGAWRPGGGRAQCGAADRNMLVHGAIFGTAKSNAACPPATGSNAGSRPVGLCVLGHSSSQCSVAVHRNTCALTATASTKHHEFLHNPHPIHQTETSYVSSGGPRTACTDLTADQGPEQLTSNQPGRHRSPKPRPEHV
jgi:hypothetical protein